MTRSFPRRPLAAAALLLIGFVPVGLSGQDGDDSARSPGPRGGPCPAAADSLVQVGWRAYRASRLEEARRGFERALAACPEHVGAAVGRGYVALREGEGRDARRRFGEVLERDSTLVDALVGLGILAWRAGDLERVAGLFRRVQRLDPDHPTARDYLARLPVGLRPAPERPPLERPDTIVHRARARGDRLEVRTPAGWRALYVKGVNLGAALPGKYPSQFPGGETYRSWIRSIGEMGANAVRVYTIHPPGLYDALAAYNRDHPLDPVRLIHGVWTELPPGRAFREPAFEEGFRSEMERVVDVVHGRADLEPRPGHAAGHYTADVSRWTLAYVVGREWEPYSVEAYVRRNPRRESWEGRYLEVRDGNAMDVWLARMCEHMVAYETRKYGQQRPIAYTTWPTLDPLTHPTEATSRERWRLRKSLGDPVGSDPPPEVDFDEDGISVDPSTTRATAAYRAGWFATYHAYPYYPDFLVLDPGYREARSPIGPSNYFGYLRDLLRHHDDLPVLVGEYGVPTGPGVAHLQPQGWHQGGHSEERMARVGARLTREIAAAGAAGGVVFEWIDEWFKRNWLVAPHEVPHERDRFWWNRMDPEENYGVLAMEPVPRIGGSTLEERREGWRRETSPVDEWADAELRAIADEAGLRLRFEAGAGAPPLETLHVGFDVLDPARGVRAWPDPGAGASPVGLEFVATLNSSGLRILPAASARRFEVLEIAPTPEEPPAYVVPEIRAPPPGFFTGRWGYRYRQPRLEARGSESGFRRLRAVTNDRRFGRDTTEFAAMGYERGRLPGGPSPDGFWQRSDDGRTVELHVPWLLLNVSDPSTGRAVFAGPEGGEELLGDRSWEVGAAADSAAARMRHVGVEAVRVVVAGRTPSGRWLRWPRPGSAAGPATVSWEGWDSPRWRSRRRPLYGALRSAFRDLEPAVADHDRETAGPEAENVDADRPGTRSTRRKR